ncbi:fimbrial protein [Serratia ureilytica]|uniref:fimbrial protein n=1 Tax=Serratia ureilytica TaxID=300181 RepID=UPI0034C5F922
MSKFKTALYLILLPCTALAGNNWNVILPGGNMRFQGEIIAEACRVEAGSRDMSVVMGQVSSNRFLATGYDAKSVPFNISLLDCSASVSRTVNISFYGVADVRNPELLSIGEGNGVASGVALAIFNEKNQLIPVNSNVDSLMYVPEKGPLSLRFIAKYRSTAPYVTGGAANAQALFSLTYN